MTRSQPPVSPVPLVPPTPRLAKAPKRASNRERSKTAASSPEASAPPASPEAVLALDDFLPYRLSTTDNLVSQLVERAYAAEGLSVAEWRVIAVLGEAEALSQRAIVDRTRMDKLTVSRAARALESRRLVRRRADPVDKRALSLSLSPAGRQLYARVIPAALDAERRLLARLDKRDRTQLEQLLAKVADAALACAAAEPRRRLRR